MDYSTGVEEIIRRIEAECKDADCGHDLQKHFSRTPLSYIFVNNKNIPVSPGKADGYFNESLTECEITFYQDAENNLRFRYFIQLTHGKLIHGLSWVKSENAALIDCAPFSRVRRYVEENLIKCHCHDAGKQTYGIWNGKRRRVGTMFWHKIENFTDERVLNQETIDKIVELISEAYRFFKTNNETIIQIINKTR